MAKAKLVFESPGTFLSFPALSPFSFRPQDLDFSRAMADPAIGAALQDFSRAVSRCPGNPIFGVDSDEYLWDHYSAWLNAMTLAESNLSPGDQAAYAAARALLVVTDANGLDSDSPVVVAYKQCRDAELNAEQAYKAAQLTATAAGDAALANWHNTDEPKLRAAVAAAETAWATTGRQADVEAAQALVARCEAAMPEKMWASWRRAYNPDLDKVTDPASNSSYAPSGFSPANLVSDDWTTLRVSGSEIAVLTAAMPKTLLEAFGEAGSSQFSQISFEFRSASVVQPWFNPAIFKARFWKFADGSALNDGGSPPSGAWPAYVVAVVLVRNIKVTPQGPPQPPVPIRAMPKLELSPAVLERLQAQRAWGGPPEHSASTPPSSVQATHPPALQTSSFTHPPQPVRPAPVFALSPFALQRLQAEHAGSPPQHSPTPQPSFVPRPQIIAAQPPSPVVTSALRRAPVATAPQLRLVTATYRMSTSFAHPVVAVPPISASPISASPSSTSTAAASPPPATSAPPDDRISILAFICKLLPKTPDPDPSLNWSGKA